MAFSAWLIFLLGGWCSPPDLSLCGTLGTRFRFGALALYLPQPALTFWGKRRRLTSWSGGPLVGHKRPGTTIGFVLRSVFWGGVATFHDRGVTNEYVSAVSQVRVETPTLPSSGPMHPQSVETARRAGAGDELAQRQLFRELRPRLHATLYRVLGSNAAIEDLLQDTFVEVFQSLPSYRGDALMTTWADRIAIRVAYRFLRRRKAAQQAPPSLCLVGSAEDELLHREGVRRLYAVLNTMKPQLRITFALFVVDGRPMKKVAELTGVSLIAAKSRVWRARRQLEQVARQDTVLARYLSRREE